MRDAFPLQPGQSGALLALGERFCLDYVSRPEAFARLYPKLLEGYLLDALEAVDSPPAGDLDAFIAAVAEGALGRRPSAGLGDDVRLHGERTVGSGLELDGELLQLCAFSTEKDGCVHGLIGSSRLPQQYFTALLARVAEHAALDGEPLVDLGRGNPEVGPPQHVIDALAAAANDPSAHGYPPFRGLPALREAIAARYS